MESPAGRKHLAEHIAGMLGRPRVLKPQTTRHLEEHLDPEKPDLPEFLRIAAGKLEDYEMEVLFAPVFTPTPEELVEVSEPLARYRPSPGDVDRIIEDLSERLESCPILLPEGGTADLRLHSVLIDRFVRLLRLENAPAPAALELVRDSLEGDAAMFAAALLRGKGFTPEHQDWYARFVSFASGRRALDRDTLRALAEFLGSQGSLEMADLSKAFGQLLQATIDAGAFAQKGRMYWSMDVAEHHNFRGSGAIDSKHVERRLKEVRLFEDLKADLDAYADLGLGGS